GQRGGNTANWRPKTSSPQDWHSRRPVSVRPRSSDSGPPKLCRASSRNTQSTIYDGGDWYTYPTPFVGGDLLDVLSASTTDATAKSYANYIVQTYPGANSRGRDQEMLFPHPA